MPRLIRRLLVCVSLATACACGSRDAAPPAAAPDAALIAATNTAVGHMGRYDFQAAVDVLTPLRAAYPASAETTFNLAVALINRQRPEDAPAAEGALRTVLDHATVGTRARYTLGLLLLYVGRDDEAFPLLSGVAAAVAGDPFPAYFAGQARLAAAPADALGWFDRARALDPLLRSAAYGAFQAHQRSGRSAEATAALDVFQALDIDPRARMAEFKYTRMGPLAEAIFVDAPARATAAPAGARFAPMTVLHAAAAAPVGVRESSITAADLDSDGVLELFVAGGGAGSGQAPNLMLRRQGTGWQTDAAHPLAGVPAVRTALWGDLDNDGRLDVVLVRGDGRTAVWRQTAAAVWRDVTATSGAATPRVDAVDGALFDADHDGDLDIWLTNAGGANALLNNNGNGQFRDIAVAAGVAGDGRGSRGVAIADLDGDRDHDIVVLNSAPPHDVFLNDRVWKYRRAGGFESFVNASVEAVLAADLDTNGRVELYTTSARGLEQWAVDAAGSVASRVLAPLGAAATPQLALADTNGDGTFEIIATSGDAWAALDLAGGAAVRVADAGAGVSAWSVVTFGTDGASLVGITADGLVEWAPGPGRNPMLTLTTTGRSQSSDQRRSNVSGIGTKVAVRAASRWTTFDTVRMQSGHGQSAQPVAVGLGGAARADLVSLVWSDGILQSELNLDGGRLHVIEETQRQLSSCPVLFADDGTATRFVTDILGVGGIGFFEQPGVYSAPFPREHVLLPPGTLGERDGRYHLVVGEPMEEAAYLDHFELAAYDLPPGWQMVLDERKAIAGPAPTGAPIFYREERLPSRAVNDRGEDVTARVTAVDRVAPPTGTPDPRFIGMTSRHALELTFDTALDRGPGRPVLMIDGWVEYPYAQTVFSAWQAGVAFEAPTLEARDATGRWRVVAGEFGYPAGMPRRMTLPLPTLPPGTVALRLTTSQEIYWDRVAVVYAEALPAAVVHEMPLAQASLHEAGFARRTTGPQRTPDYDYDRRAPLWDTRHPRGWYTAFGDVAALVAAADDAVAVIGPGEEVRLAFTAPRTDVPAGWTRQLVLRARGWCKDMDLYTRDGETVEPMPGRDTAARRRLHAAFNTRFENGR